MTFCVQAPTATLLHFVDWGRLVGFPVGVKGAAFGGVCILFDVKGVSVLLYLC